MGFVSQFGRSAGFSSPLLILLLLGACSEQPAQEPAHMSPTPPEPPAPGVASRATSAANAAVAAQLDLDDPSDHQAAERGWLASIDGAAIIGADGRIVWPVNQFDFLDGAAPATVNPSLWRQSQLTAMHGLFAVADGIWQVRGYDLAVMTVIRGDTGWIIVDPLTTTETAAAALNLVNETIEHRPVSALI